MFNYSPTTIFGNNQIYLKTMYLHKKPGAMGSNPMYIFSINETETHTRVGELTLRIGNASCEKKNRELYFWGNIGYGIDPPFRGKGYAVEAIELSKFYAHYHAMDKIHVVCNVNNAPSIRIVEKAGGVFVNQVECPPEFCDEHDKVPTNNRYCIYV